MKLLPLLSVFLHLAFNGHSQFLGLETFATDTIVQRSIRINHVKAVAESIRDDSSAMYNGRCSFNTSGRVTEFVAGGQKTTFKYQGNNLVRRDNFSDTARQITSWQTWTLNANGLAYREGYGIVKDGKIIEYLKSDTKVISGELGKERYETYYYSAGKSEKTLLTYDTIMGIDTCRITCEYRAQDTLRKFPERSMKCLVKKERFAAEHTIKYSRTIKPGEVYMIQTVLYQYDEAERLIAVYDVEHLRPNGATGKLFSNYGPTSATYPPEMVKSLLAGDTTGVKKLLLKYTYDAAGNLVESVDEQYRYHYYYNKKRLMSRMEISLYARSYKAWAQSLPYDEAVYTYNYNARGLFSKVTLTYKTQDGKQKVIERTYRYWYR